MKRTLTNTHVDWEAEQFVISIFDSIKCAAQNGCSLQISITAEEVKEIGEVIKAVNWIEIN